MFIAVVDGQLFNTRDENKYSAELANKSADVFLGTSPTQPKMTRVANTLSFFGNQFFDEDGNTAEERISIEYGFNEGVLGECADQKIMLHYNNEKYYNIASDTKFKVTKLMWSGDRRYCVVNAEFDCKMRRWGVPAEAQPVVRMKGKMENINVTVPSWVVLKNPAQTAFGE
ncbi:MAG: hypothetical protein IPP77_00515 [Bacteroidetes bacterium]|nr:hypothetical protein [Bacteroidota bacterium]